MTNWFRIFIGILMLLASHCAFEAPAFGQTSVIVEVRVLELSSVELDGLGGAVTRQGFAKSLSKERVESLLSGSRSKIVHRIDLQAKSGISTQFRLESRITNYGDVGIGLDAMPRVFQNRDISLETASQVRIRRGQDVNGVQPVVFENPLTRFETRIHEGESIVLGGFITGEERMALPNMPALPDNPILNYLFPRKQEPQDRSEIAILLTPRIVGTLINGAVDSAVPVGRPATVNPTAMLNVLPAVSTSTGMNALAIANSSPAINRPTVSSPAVNNTPGVSDLLSVEGTGGKFTVQVGAFDKLEKAEALRSQLSKRYDMVFVDKIAVGKAPYRVRVGRFPDMSAARQIERKLIVEGLDTYITALN